MNRTNLAVALTLAALALEPALARAQTDTTTTTTATATTTGAVDATATTTATATATTTGAVDATATTSVTTEPAESAFDETEPVAVAPAPVSPPMFLLSIRVGAFVPQVFNRLDASFTVSLGIGYVLPFLDYRVAIVVDGFYTRPERSETLSDPRLATGTYHYGLVQNDISLFAGFLVHFTDLARETFVPYAGLGARVHFLWTEIDGSSGATTNTTGFHRETSTQGGGAVRVGLGIRVGPGLIALDAELSLAPLDHLITGGANIGALGIAAGYTFVF